MNNDRIFQTAQKIISFLDFQPGWHFGEGKTPSKNIVDAALALNDELKNAGFNKTSAFLGTSGEIMVTAYHGLYYLEFTIEPNKSVTLLLEHDDNEIEYKENLELSEAFLHIKRFRGLLAWSSYASSICITTTTTIDALRALPSNLPILTEEFLSSRKIVPYKTVKVYASISKDSTKLNQGLSLSSGTSTLRYFLKSADLHNKQPKVVTPATTTFLACQ